MGKLTRPTSVRIRDPNAVEQAGRKRDLSNLERDGGIDFTLPGLDAGTLTALRVEEVSPDTVEIPPSRLNPAI